MRVWRVLAYSQGVCAPSLRAGTRTPGGCPTLSSTPPRTHNTLPTPLADRTNRHTLTHRESLSATCSAILRAAANTEDSGMVAVAAQLVNDKLDRTLGRVAKDWHNAVCVLATVQAELLFRLQCLGRWGRLLCPIPGPARVCEGWLPCSLAGWLQGC